MIFITGGVRSGKSTFAEKRAIEVARAIGGRLHYVATGVSADEEMKERITRHQQERQNSGFIWTTWEQPTEIGKLSAAFTLKDVVLLDCVTTLLNNELFSQKKWDEGLLARLVDGIEDIQSCCGQLILVSNEILNEPVSENRLVLDYSRMLGNLHQKIVEKAEEAYLVETGIPILMKGEKR